MWNEIRNEKDLTQFMEKIGYFHDSCIKELKYISGAYVNKELGMYPINDCRVLNVIIQRQNEKFSMIEMEFEGLKCLKLFPEGENDTCEILDSTMILEKGEIYWTDCGGMTEKDFEGYRGTFICAAKFRWRSIEQCMGKDEFFLAAK